MSAAEFTPVIRNRIIDIFGGSENKIDLATFRKQTRKQIFKDAPDTKDIRKKFESKGFHSSSLTIDGMSVLANRLTSVIKDEVTKNQVSEFFNDGNFFTNFVTFLENKDAGIVEYGSGDYRLENIPQDKLKSYFVDYLTEQSNFSKETINLLKDNVQSGHLAGVFFLKLKVALGVSTSFSREATASYRDFSVSLDGMDPGPEADKAIKVLDSVLKAVLDADYITSNLLTHTEVFVDATKQVLGDDPKLYTELQFKEDNKAAGDLLQQTGLKLNNLIKAAIAREQNTLDRSFSELIKSLQPVVNVILQKAEELKQPLDQNKLYSQIVGNAKNLQGLIDDLIKTPGSPSYVKAIGMNIANVIKTGKKLPKEITRAKPKPITNTKKDVLDISQVAREFEKAVKQTKETTKKLKQKAKETSRLRTLQGHFYSLSNLQALLTAKINETVKNNMGDGTRKDILNLRTGRFADSVEIKGLTESRSGMITAFYSYMKNPYATFSEGGMQSYPKTRDPKLLISSSIRQIAGEKVTNRLRAVLIWVDELQS